MLNWLLKKDIIFAVEVSSQLFCFVLTMLTNVWFIDLRPFDKLSHLNSHSVKTVTLSNTIVCQGGVTANFEVIVANNMCWYTYTSSFTDYPTKLTKFNDS